MMHKPEKVFGLSFNGTAATCAVFQERRLMSGYLYNSPEEDNGKHFIIRDDDNAEGTGAYIPVVFGADFSFACLNPWRQDIEIAPLPWSCGYCGTLNESDTLKCCGCQAPVGKETE